MSDELTSGQGDHFSNEEVRQTPTVYYGAVAVSDSNALRQEIKIKHGFLPDERAVRVARDFVAVADHQGTKLKALGEIDDGEAVPLALEDTLQDPTVLPLDSAISRRRLGGLYQYFFRTQDREMLEGYLGCQLADLSLRSQLQFLAFISEADETALERIFQSVAKQSKINKVVFWEAFFATAGDKVTAGKLIEFARDQGAEVNTITQKFNDALHHLENAEKEIQEIFGASPQPVDTRVVVHEFLNRLRKIMQQCLQNHETRTNVPWENLVVDVQFFCSLLKTAFKGKQSVPLAEIKGLDLTTYDTAELSSTEKNTMLEIIKANYISRGEIGEQAVAGVNEVFEKNTPMNWRVLKHNGEIVGFLRFAETGRRASDGRPVESAGSFNIHPAYRGAVLGEALMQHALIVESEHAVLEAVVDPQILVGTRYVEDVGFSITGVRTNFLGTKETFFEIICDRERNKTLRTKDVAEYSQEALKKLLNNFTSIDEQIKKQVSIIVVRANTTAALNLFIEKTSRLTRGGYVGTRYFAESENSDERYLVFERGA